MKYACWLLLAACGTEARTIDLEMPGKQALVAEKVDGGAWKNLTGQFDGTIDATTYPIEIGDEYQLAVVCVRSGPRDAGQFVAAEVFGTSEDPDITLASWEVPSCVDASATTTDPVTLTGTFGEDMDIAVGPRSAHVRAGNVFVLTADAGTHDLIAYANTKILIQRDLVLQTDTTLSPVSVTTDGASMLAVPVDLPLESDEFYFVYELLQTANGTSFVWLDEDPAGALFVPKELLAPGDQQRLSASLDSITGQRSIDARDPLQLGDGTLLSRIATATSHAQLGATWTAIPDFYTTATVTTYATNDSEQRVTAAKSWLDRHGKTVLDFDTTVAGYDPSWTLTEPVIVSLERWSAEVVATTTLYAAQAP